MVTEALASPRLVAGVAGSIEVTVYGDGEAIDILDAPAPTCALVNADTGATFIESAPVTEVPTGRLRVSLTAAQTATPARLKATWTFSVGDPAVAQTLVTYHEIVGDVPFTLSEARAFDAGALQSSTKYPDADILAMRDRIAEAFEEICGVAFGTRATRETLDGSGRAVVWLAKAKCIAVSAAATRSGATWTELTEDELADLQLAPNGRLDRERRGVWPEGRRNVRVDYTHGWERVPLEIRRAALWVLRQHLAGSNLPANAISQVDPLGTFQLSIPGRRENTWFGIPEADEVLSRYGLKLPGIG